MISRREGAGNRARDSTVTLGLRQRGRPSVASTWQRGAEREPATWDRWGVTLCPVRPDQNVSASSIVADPAKEPFGSGTALCRLSGIRHWRII